MSIRFHFVTMGCPKNVFDSEGMALLLEKAGHQEAPERQADVVIVNTCGFLDAAKRESLAEIRSVLRRKRPQQALIAAGCLVQRDKSELLRAVPGLDAVLGTRHCDEIVGVVERVADARRLRGDARSEVDAATDSAGTVKAPSATSGDAALHAAATSGDVALHSGVRPRRVSAYIKIADGCDRSCAFCTIPSIKGPFASRSVDDILADGRRLAAEGVRELVLVAQESSRYGADRGEREGLAALLPRLAGAVPEVPWLRLLYAYPTTVTPRLVETWALLPQVVRYLDIPLQHGHPDVLRRMRRPHDVERTVRLLEDLRRALPGLALRTTFIVGYPGETEAEFQALLDFMSALRFDNVGIFTYSREIGTPAADLPGQVPRRVQRERYSRAMLHQQAISLEKNREFVGATLQVLIEGQADGQAARRREKAKVERLLVGRCYRQAPEIDGLVFARGQVAIGDMVQVHITQATEYDLWGDVI